MDSIPNSEPIQWSGDLNDDCTAIWGGMMLRAEKMDDNIWWWAVIGDEGHGDQIYSSNEEASECQSGDDARQKAESCAVDMLNSPTEKS